MQEKIVETKNCKQCNISFEITDKDIEFYDNVSPKFDWEKYSVPTPTLCSDCRQQRRLSWRNENSLYKRKCDLTKKSVVSIYTPDKNFITYNQDDWWSDKWSPFDYWVDFDFNKTFFEQFKELQEKVPRITVLNWFSENADYWNHSYHNKNSFMVNSCAYVEDSYFCINTWNLKNCIDCERTFSSDNCYSCLESSNCSKSQYLQNCHDCFSCFISINCIWCRNCIWCKELKNKEYYLFNKPVSKEEFEKVLNDFFNNPKKRKEILDKFNEIKSQIPTKYINNTNCENISESNNCTNSQGVKWCFDCENSKNIAYSTDMMLRWWNDCYDFDIWWEDSSLVYEVHCSWNATKVLFSNVIWWWYNVYYSDNCLTHIENCFGCIWLHNNENYCILNKQYTKEEYNNLVPKIIEHMQKTWEWWEFFPSSLSPFWYNETVANEYFPLSKESAIKSWFNWSDYEAPFPKVEKIIPANKLPDSINDIPDDILNWAIKCEDTKKPFKIISQELWFYRKYNLPIPRKHPDKRHLDRMELRNPRKLFDRDCDKCGISMKTTYSKYREEKVYCEECYNKEVY